MSDRVRRMVEHLRGEVNEEFVQPKIKKGEQRLGYVYDALRVLMQASGQSEYRLAELYEKLKYTLYRNSYRTLARDINVLVRQGKISKEVVLGGKDGTFTLVSLR